MIKYASLLLYLCVIVPQASATPAWQAFIAGNYTNALHAGRSENTANGLTIACRSNLVLGGFLTDNKSATTYLHAAIKDCAHALQLNNRHFDAQMSLAIALSFEGKRVKSIFFPRTARLMLERLIQEHPTNALAYGALAAWHSQVSASGFFARLTLKASRKQARYLFNEAFRHGVIDFPLRVEHLKFLAMGTKQDRVEAVKIAEALVKAPTTTDFDRLLQQRCNALIPALHEGNKRQIKKVIEMMSAFSQAEHWEDADAFPKKDVPKF